MQYYAIQCNTMQYHASLLTDDGTYHCPVGSIMAIFLFWPEFTISAMSDLSLDREMELKLRGHWEPRQFPIKPLLRKSSHELGLDNPNSNANANLQILLGTNICHYYGKMLKTQNWRQN